MGGQLLTVGRVSAGKFVLVVAFAVTLALPWPAHAAPRFENSGVKLDDLSATILEPWRDRQLPDGNYVRPSGSTVWDPMGTSSIAYSTLMLAKRTGNEAQFRSAMAAFDRLATRRVRPQGVFFRLFITSGYNFARRHYRGRTEFKKIRRAWENRLRRIKYGDRSFRTGYRYNKNVVEALTVLELLRSRLRSRIRGSVLHNRKRARSRAIAVIRRHIPARVAEFGLTVGPEQGWPRRAMVAEVSDIPDNPPAYNALVASMYVRAVSLLPARSRTPGMRHAARTLTRSLAARMPPDGDLTFNGRTQELSWSLTSAMHAAWWSSRISASPERAVLFATARRAFSRLRSAHMNDGEFLLTPALGCCIKDDHPKGHDVYFDISNYSGLTAVHLEWALADRPRDWADGSGRLPTDGNSIHFQPRGRGRYVQFSTPSLYWMVRGQGNSADARLDMGVSVMKVRRADGSWADVVPPHPLTGGHHLPADPAGPCLRAGPEGKTCAYLQLHRGVRSNGGFRFSAVWRTPRRTIVDRGTAWLRPTSRGLVLSWSTRSGQVFQVDHFLQAARCAERGVAAPGILVEMRPLGACRIVARGYAGGSHSDLDRVRAMITGDGAPLMLEYIGNTG
ncbi:MAG: hypothetical protein ACPGYP_02100 [Solirubrobacterales bacterium]